MKCLGALSLILVFSPMLAAASPSVDEILSLVQVTAKTATLPYQETKQFQALDHPLSSQGSFSFTPPDTLEDQVWSPEARQVKIQGQEITVIDAQGSHTVDLSNYPNLWANMSVLRALLTHQEKFLREYYAMSVEGDLTHWKLLLSPKNHLNLRIRTVMIMGSGNHLKQITWSYANGDWIRITFPTLGEP